jgi:hypothetical protein
VGTPPPSSSSGSSLSLFHVHEFLDSLPTLKVL